MIFAAARATAKVAGVGPDVMWGVVETKTDHELDELAPKPIRIPLMALLAGMATAGCLVLGVSLAVSQNQLHLARQELVRSRQIALESQAGLRQCTTGKMAVEAALRAQNEAAAAWRRTGGGRDLPGRNGKAAVIMARQPAGGDACLRAMEADRLIGEFVR